MADGINDLIEEMQKKLRVTSITVTHDLKSAYKIADRIAMLYEGKIIGMGTPEQIENTQDPVIRQFITGSATGPITE
jgi:phospholipid/cholesterol/gamma-HCH transport system ATP-binding protein